MESLYSVADGSEVQLFEFDIPNLRYQMQVETDEKLAKKLEEGVTERQSIIEYINEKKLDRQLKDFNLSERDYLMKSQGDNFLSKIMAQHLAKSAARRSSKIESYTFNGMDKFLKQHGIRITQLQNTKLRPAKDGKVYCKIQHKNKFGNTNYDYKTIDFEIHIDGKLFGRGSYKYCLGAGGHQDNVFNEEKRWLEWGRDISEKKDLTYIALVDTNAKKEYDKLKKEFDNPQGNIWVVNHVELQERLIDAV